MSVTASFGNLSDFPTFVSNPHVELGTTEIGGFGLNMKTAWSKKKKGLLQPPPCREPTGHRSSVDVWFGIKAISTVLYSRDSTDQSQNFLIEMRTNTSDALVTKQLVSGDRGETVQVPIQPVTANRHSISRSHGQFLAVKWTFARHRGCVHQNSKRPNFGQGLTGLSLLLARQDTSYQIPSCVSLPNSCILTI